MGEETSDSVTALRPHPRLVLTNDRIAEIRREMESDPVARGLFAELRLRADGYLQLPPPEHRVEGRRLLGVSRRVVAYVLTFALLARLTDDERYVAAARREMLAAAAFPDWNPSHFLDAAEMATALALGYDWLYESLSADERSTIEQALLAKAIAPVFQQDWFWFTGSNNWNSVCHTGIALAALAVMDIDPPRANAVLDLVRNNIGRVAASYGPDGAYDEGPMYWDYGTSFLVLLCSAMETATGKPFDPNVPGLFASADYMTHVVAPSGQFYNYSDCRLERAPMPALFWFAARLNRPALAATDSAHFAKISVAKAFDMSTRESDRLLPLALIWQRPAESRHVQLPNTWFGGGHTPVALMRTNWRDANAAFVGIKGGSPLASHGHMDVGSFVYENAGVRWAIDLPLQEYHSLEVAGLNLWDNDQTSDRWSVFRLGPDGHGILRFDDRPQIVEGFAPLKSLPVDGAVGNAEVDLSSLYPAVNRLTRTAMLRQDGSLELADRWQTRERPVRMSWQMLTPAVVDVLPDGFVLRHPGKRLRVEFESAGHAISLTVAQVDSLTRSYDAANPGVSRLVASLAIPAHSAGELRTRLFLIDTNA